MLIIKLIFFSLLTILSSPLLASNPSWSTQSLTLLYGSDFEVDPRKQTTATLEHASGWSWGDLFLFVDFTHYHNSSLSDGFYGEFSPRLSLGKLSDQDLSTGLIKDILVASTYEFGKGDVESFLIGPGVDLDIPGMDFFSLNIYKRFPLKDQDGDSIQLTTAWSTTFPVAKSDMIFDGYIDWNINNDDSYHANLHFNPQLKYDLGKNLGYQEKQFLIGVEYSYWTNKYGIKNTGNFKTDQQVFSLLLQSHF